MWPIAGVNRVRVAVLLMAVLFGAGLPAFAQQKNTYEGDIVGVDAKAMTFTVKGTKAGATADMAFKVDPGSQLFIDGQRRLLGELEKGDHVVVTYSTSGATHTAQRTDRMKTAVRELTFTGNVIAVDTGAHTFTVRKSGGGTVEEMMFHASPGTRLYISGEPILLAQLQKGDEVTVAYESVGTVHHVKHVKR
ncbi:MAG: hypothetical protein AB7Q16_16220 [Vicinamibacterales bacterium]